MRIRLQCSSPAVKAWASTDAETILDLKKHICDQFIPQANFHQLALSLDDFDLLDSSTARGVLRDGDIVAIKVTDVEPPRKRLKTSATSHLAVAPKKQHKNAVASSSKTPSASKPVLTTKRARSESSDMADSSDSSVAPVVVKVASSSSSSDSSSSSESSSSSSDSDSDSDSSESSSDSDGSPPAQPTKPLKATQKKAPVAPAPEKPKLTGPLVPPGHGKSTTHSRNLRRRIKKKHDAEAEKQPQLSAAPKGTSASNSIPIGIRSDFMDVDAEEGDQAAVEAALALAREQDAMITAALLESGAVGASTDNYGVDAPAVSDIFMSTLRNKNKKKGFKSSMAVALPSKIVFGQDGMAVKVDKQPRQQSTKNTPASALPFAEADVPAPPRRDASGNAYNTPRLIPPSELQDAGLLPPNLFVTSIDVEEGMHGKKGKNKKKKAVVEVHQEYHEMEYGAAWSGQGGGLDYGDEPGAVVEAVGGGFGEREFANAERDFDKLVLVSEIGQLQTATIVGWKELAINTVTFTPEMLLHVAKVISTTAEDVVAQMILREGASGAASFSARLVEAEYEAEIIEETYSFGQVVESGWRMIR